ncbi:THO complex subunit 3-like [Gordionus sp. m RMFG-2023]|uniref:THO complex subunit 3-like n=1 Tax=Gordionus sp. m RMFG-2023 TaxID=3053472 RepID=UPI0031FE21E9
MPMHIVELRKHFLNQNNSKDYTAHLSKVHSVAWNCRGDKLASGSLDKTACVYALDKDKLIKELSLKGHADTVDQLCWHPINPYQLVTASGDKTVRLWDIKSSKSYANIPTKGENINVCWSPDGNTIAVGSKDDLVTFIDVKKQSIIAEEQFKFEVNEISWNNENDLFFLTTGQGNISILNYPDLKIQQVIYAHPSNCICIKFDPTGRYFAIGSTDALISIWHSQELICLNVIARLEWPIRSVSFSYDGKILASASEDLIIDLANVPTGEKLGEVKCRASTFTIAWHPSKYILAYACDDKDKSDKDAGTVKLYGVPNEIVDTLPN